MAVGGTSVGTKIGGIDHQFMNNIEMSISPRKLGGGYQMQDVSLDDDSLEENQNLSDSNKELLD